MASGFSVVISAVDKASAKLDQINKRISRLSAPVTRLQASFKKFSQVSGLTKLGEGFRSVATRSLEAFKAMSRIITPLGAITGAASLAGMYKLASSWGEFGSRLGNAAIRTRMSAQELHGLEGAARLSGASADSLVDGMRFLGDAMTDAAGGRSPEVTALFGRLSIAFQDSAGHAKKATQVLPALADKIAMIQDPIIQAQFATMLFGGAAEDLLPLLRKGSVGIQDYVDKAKKYGLINDKGAASARELRERQVALELSVEGLGYSVAESLTPVLGPMLQKLSDWIAANRDWIRPVSPRRSPSSPSG